MSHHKAKISYFILFSLLLLLNFLPACTPSFEERQIKAGEEQEAQGQYEKALLYYWEAYQENPRGPYADQALFAMGNLYYYYLKNPPRALEIYQQLITNFPRSSKTSKAQVVVAEIYDESLGDYRRAAQEYKKILASTSESKEGRDRLQFKMARCYYKAGAFEDAIKAFQDLLLLYPASELTAEARYQIAQTYYTKGDFATAIANFDKLSRTSIAEPLKSDVLMGLAASYEEQGELDKAEEIYKQIEDTYRNRGVVQDRLKRVANLKVEQQKIDKIKKRR